MPIKLVSLNIEGSRHLKKRVLPFLKSENPDVVCLQEVFQSDVELIKKTLKMTGLFVPIALMSYKKNIHHPDPIKDQWGLLTLSKKTINGSGFEYYYGNPKKNPIFYPGLDPNIINRAIAWLQISDHGQIFQIVNTHFTWSYNGEVTELQRKTLTSLYKCLKKFKDLVLVGDLNTPRGRDLYFDLSSKFRDNIPCHISTTIDNDLHRSSENLQFVVDGLLSSPKYKISKVSLVNGVSDHFALSCQMSENSIFFKFKEKIKIDLKRFFFFSIKFIRWLASD